MWELPLAIALVQGCVVLFHVATARPCRRGCLRCQGLAAMRWGLSQPLAHFHLANMSRQAPWLGHLSPSLARLGIAACVSMAESLDAEVSALGFDACSLGLF